MQIAVNGEPQEVPEGSTVRALLEQLGLGEARVAVERNRAVVPRNAHGSTALEGGDEIEVVHFVGGG